jgi:hypothetical protein
MGPGGHEHADLFVISLSRAGKTKKTKKTNEKIEIIRQLDWSLCQGKHSK